MDRTDRNKVGQIPELHRDFRGRTVTHSRMKKILKRTEQVMGDSHQNHQLGKVLIDIDLIQYGNETIRKIAWL